MNETKRGWLENHESIDVSLMARGEQRRINNHKEDFEVVNTRKSIQYGLLYSLSRMKNVYFPQADPSKFDSNKELNKRRKYLKGMKIQRKSRKKLLITRNGHTRKTLLIGSSTQIKQMAWGYSRWQLVQEKHAQRLGQ